MKNKFFSNLNNTSCYWAGFIAADGCLPKDREHIAISLCKKDVDHLRKFQKVLKSDSKVSIKYDACHFRPIHAEQLRKDLTRIFNITPCKSLTLKPPRIKNEKHIASFIRGVVDGDGSIYFGKKNLSWSVEILGTMELLSWIKENVSRYVLRAGTPNIIPTANVFRLRYCGKQVKYILNWLYENSNDNSRLDRKYNRYLRVLSYNRYSKDLKGVYFEQNRWVAKFTEGGKKYYLGRFNSLVEAQRAYSKGIKKWSK